MAVLHLHGHCLFINNNKTGSTMKYLLYIVLFNFCYRVAIAQQTDTTIGKVYYTFRHMTDSTVPSVFHTENMVLLLGKELNAYISLDKLVQDSLVQKQLEDGISGFSVRMSGKKVIRTRIFTDKTSQKLVLVETILREYLYDENFPDFKWQITGEVKEIGKFKCTRATGSFRGRTYHAWFTTETPFTGAPWKLHGLPGLVLEAQDTRGHVFFQFNGIEQVQGGNLLDIPSGQAVKVTRKEFLQIKEASQNDPAGFINASAGEMGSNVKVTSANSGTGNIKPRKALNPLELTSE